MTMDMELLQRYDAPVPRYTSYPTAPHFHAGIDAGVYRDWLAAIPAGERMSLYLHVPFCTRMCWYCGCHTKVVRQYRPVADYAAVLDREIALTAGAVPKGPEVSHVHWGGGTPTMLSPEDFSALMSTLRARFDFAEGAEVAVPRLIGRWLGEEAL